MVGADAYRSGAADFSWGYRWVGEGKLQGPLYWHVFCRESRIWGHRRQLVHHWGQGHWGSSLLTWHLGWRIFALSSVKSRMLQVILVDMSRGGSGEVLLDWQTGWHCLLKGILSMWKGDPTVGPFENALLVELRVLTWLGGEGQRGILLCSMKYVTIKMSQ